MTVRSLYDLLRLPPTATMQEIEAAYQQLVRATPHSPRELDHAYAVLSDPTRRAAYDSLCRERVDEPPLRLWLRVYGVFSGLAGTLSRVRWKLIPVNWVVALVLLLVASQHVTGELIPYLNEPTPTPTTIREIISKRAGPRFVTVVGRLHPEPLYVEDGGEQREFYALVDAQAVLIVTHVQPDQVAGSVTGRLVEMESDLRELVAADAARVGLPFERVHYLDAARLTVIPAVSYTAVALLCLAALLLVVPGLHGYTAFAPAEPTLTLLPRSLFPLLVKATGRYISPEGKTRFQVGTYGLVHPTDDPAVPFLVQTEFVSGGAQYGVIHQIHLPRGATVEWGWDYSFGKPKPALLIRSEAGKTLLTLADAPTAAGLAALLERELA